MLLENSIEEFVERFREHAALGHLYPQTEGSVLLEFSCAGQVIYLFDRTGPYLRPFGDQVPVIVHPLLASWDFSPEQVASLATPRISAIHGVGQVSHLYRGFVVVNSLFPLVFGILEDQMPKLAVGDWIRFESLAPVHGFVVSNHRY